MSDLAVGSFAQLAPDEPYPGVTRRTFDSDGATVTRYEFGPGASFPLHRHRQEQITLVEAGSVLMSVGDREEQLEAGGWSVVAGGVEHGIVAGPSGARVVAVIVPRRESADAYEVTRS